MREIKIKLSEILEFISTDIIDIKGDWKGVYVDNLSDAQNVNENSLDWINSCRQDKQNIAETSKAKVLLVDKSIEYSQAAKKQKKVLIVVDNPKRELLKIGNYFFKEHLIPSIHPSAVIHPEAVIGDSVYIGSGVSIGKCIIGDHVIIYPNVVINDCVDIGNHVIIKPGAILGFDGFGYERDENNNLEHFPQLGKLIIYDHVEIGANTCIDRGALSDSIIGFNTKINNLCHIAHNVIIGKNTIITAQVNISGSTIIGDNVWIAPNVSLRGHQIIGNNVIVGMGAVVTKDIPDNETWIGNPAKKMMR